MLSNSSKYALNAVIYLAINSSVTQKIGVKEIAEVLNIPLPFLAKILQSLAKKDVISSAKGPGGGFFITDNEKNTRLIDVVYHIDGTERFEKCAMGLSHCSTNAPCPMHQIIFPFREQFIKELSENSIKDFAQKVERGEAFLYSINVDASNKS